MAIFSQRELWFAFDGSLNGPDKVPDGDTAIADEHTYSWRFDVGPKKLKYLKCFMRSESSRER
jgi:hypothetical protein